MLKFKTKSDVKFEIHSLFIDSNGLDSVVIPYKDFLLHADFERSQENLILRGTGSDVGLSVLVEDFFKQGALPIDLQTLIGARVTWNLARLLAGPEHPGVTAQLGDVANQGIGLINTIISPVIIIRAGVEIEAVEDMVLYEGDIIKTGLDALVGLVYADGTLISLGSDGRMVIEELFYDPEIGKGLSSTNVIQGTFSFVSGAIAKLGDDAMVFKTPVAVIGVRGTTVVGTASAEGSENIFTLLKDSDGGVGSISISNAVGVVVLSEANQTTTVTGFYTAPTKPFIMTDFELLFNYGKSVSERSLTTPVSEEPASEHSLTDPASEHSFTDPASEESVSERSLTTPVSEEFASKSFVEEQLYDQFTTGSAHITNSVETFRTAYKGIDEKRPTQKHKGGAEEKTSDGPLKGAEFCESGKVKESCSIPSDGTTSEIQSTIVKKGEENINRCDNKDSDSSCNGSFGIEPEEPEGTDAPEELYNVIYDTGSIPHRVLGTDDEDIINVQNYIDESVASGWVDTGKGWRIYGNRGADIITGSRYDDFIMGGKSGDGENRLTGGDGADIFALTEFGEYSIIQDFNPTEDGLHLSNAPSSYNWVPFKSGDWSVYTNAIVYQGFDDGVSSLSTSSMLIFQDPQGIELGGFDDVNWNIENANSDFPGSFISLTAASDEDNSISIHGTSGDDFLLLGKNLTYPKTVYGYQGDDLIRNQSSTVSELFGEDGRDMIYGGSAGDFIIGGHDGDFLMGNGGDDDLVGSGGSDFLVGGHGNDNLTGDFDEDEIDEDEVGLSTDYFGFLTPNDGVDTILDFQPGVDKLAFVDFEFRNMYADAGNQYIENYNVFFFTAKAGVDKSMETQIAEYVADASLIIADSYLVFMQYEDSEDNDIQVFYDKNSEIGHDAVCLANFRSVSLSDMSTNDIMEYSEAIEEFLNFQVIS